MRQLHRHRGHKCPIIMQNPFLYTIFHGNPVLQPFTMSCILNIAYLSHCILMTVACCILETIVFASLTLLECRNESLVTVQRQGTHIDSHSAPTHKMLINIVIEDVISIFTVKG